MTELSEEFYAQREASRTYDYRLVTLLDVMFGMNDEHEDSSIGLSVLVSGTNIRGTAISRALWESEQITNLEASGDVSHATLAEFLQGMFEADAEHAADAKAEFPERNYVRRWLHFRDATVIAGSQTVEYPHFRVSIDAVQGWSIGS